MTHKPRRPYPLPLAVLALEQHGPMTARELALKLGMSRAHMSVKISRAREYGLIYIKAWRREASHGMLRQYLRAVYAVGNRRDAPKPPALTKVESNTLHRARKRALIPTSVFALALPVEHRRMTTRRRPDVAARHAANREEKHDEDRTD